MRRLVLILAVFLMPAMVFAETAVNTAAPEFSLPDPTGKMHALSDYRGKFVVLEWFNPGCPFVKKHYGSGNMQQLQKKYTAQGAVWLTISSNAEGKQGYINASNAAEIIAEKKLASTALLLDHEGSVGHAYGARTTPHMFVISPKGELVYSGAIDDNDSPDPEAISSSKNYVAAVLDQGLAGQPITVAATEPYGCSVKYRS